MPSEHNPQPFPDPGLSQHQQSQHKSCPSCCALVLVPELDAPATCPNCRQQLLLRVHNNNWRLIDQDLPLHQPLREQSVPLHSTRRSPDPPTSPDALPTAPLSPPPLSIPPLISLPKIDPPAIFAVQYSSSLHSKLEDPPGSLDVIPRPSHPSMASPRDLPHSSKSQSKSPAVQVSISTPDPLLDITRIRVRSRVNHCLYPGAIFEGTQKSGRNSYDVTVTIVDVDFTTSFLCGYLCIRGLTDDWPELTTYFDAEIIGSRHGFLTQNWGASENEDLVHWSRFPAFRYIRHEAKRPRMTIDDRDRGAVFMRWKEKFLVPDHRVQDINGASFAGFYYVCVDFNPAATASANNTAGPQGDGEEEAEEEQQRSGRKQHRTRRSSSTRKTSAAKRTPSLTPYTAPVATMSGFYYHQNSEPYQQLSLTHVPESSSSNFEFR